MKFYISSRCSKKNYQTKTKKYKWYGFFDYYLARGEISCLETSYYITVDITDLNWRDCKEDKHWYQYRKHESTLYKAKQWCEFIMKNPPNYVDEIWGHRKF